MKIVLKTLLALSIIIFAVYKGCFYMMPSAIVLNDSGEVVNEFTVKLPNSNLNFGSLTPAQKNEIHYSIEQSDGSYEYQVVFYNKTVLSGACGYVTNSEIHKRVLFTVKRNEVVCSNGT
jgi:hypothetical protein